VTWDIRVVSTLAQSYHHASGHSVAGAAEIAVARKEAKPSILVSPKLSFCTDRARNSGGIAPCSLDFLTEVSRRLTAATGDARETAFLFQRNSVALRSAGGSRLRLSEQMGLEVSFEGILSTAVGHDLTSDGSELQVCGAATEKDRRANSVRVLRIYETFSSGASDET